MEVIATFRLSEAGDTEVSTLPGRSGRNAATAKPMQGWHRGTQGNNASVSLLPPSSTGLPLASPARSQRTEEPGFGAEPLKSTDNKERQMEMKGPLPWSGGTNGRHPLASCNPAWFFPTGQWQLLVEE